MNGPFSAALVQRTESGWRASLAMLAVQWPLWLAVAIPTIVWMLQRDIGLSLIDEGFVWYGAQRVLAGEVPLRDFQAYDIGRYYWYAGWMAVMDSTGILPVRAGSTVLAAITTAIAVALVRGAGRQGAVATVLAAVTFALWLVPYFKVADSFAAVLLLAGMARLLKAPGARSSFAYGLCLGVAATVGINHALYGVAAGMLAFACLWWNERRIPRLRTALAVALGTTVGYLPVLAFVLFEPGFATAFVDSVRLLLETGTTNLELAMPDLRSPWRATSGWTFLVGLQAALMGIAFIAIPLFLLASGWQVWRLRTFPSRAAHPAFVAALLLSIPYAHYAYSRWDVYHLAISALPLMLAVWTFPGPRPVLLRTVVLALVTLATLLVAGPNHAFFQTVRSTPLQPVVVAGETLRVPERTAAELRLLDETVRAHAAAPRSLYVVPYWPGAYAVTGRRSPTWEIYLIFPFSERRQRLEIGRLVAADVGLALVSRSSMDGRADLGLEQTHPLIARYLRQCLVLQRDYASPVSGVDVLVGRRPGCTTASSAP